MTQSKRLTSISKFMSYVLRHKPESVGLKLSPTGWADIDELVKCGNQSVVHGQTFTKEDVLEVVRTCEKQRYALSEDGLLIRANQGHSTDAVVLDLPIVVPPGRLYHGTALHHYATILIEGIRCMNRHHVHLSSDYDTALQVGQRHGEPCVLAINTARMAADGVLFMKSANSVWLTEYVDPKYILKPIKENA